MARPIKTKKAVLKQRFLKKKPSRAIKAATKIKVEAKKEALKVQEITAGITKFSHPEICRIPKAFSQELPSQYGVDKMVLMVRDPWWLYTYWEIKQETVERLKSELKDEFYKAKRTLRIYDISNIIFNGSNANSFFDIEIHEFANNWYIDTAGPGRSWCVDLGLQLSDGRFITILRSNAVQTPLDGPSWITDEEWMVPDDMFARLYGMGSGQGRSSPRGKERWERIRNFSGIASMSSPVKKPQKR